jgi:glutathione S-transferase
LEPKRAAGEAALQLMDEQLARQPFFVGESLTLADVALFAYTHVAEEGGFRLDDLPNVQSWLHRVAAEPGYISMNAE